MHIYNAVLCYITLAVNEKENAANAVIKIFPHLESHGNTTTDFFIILLFAYRSLPNYDGFRFGECKCKEILLFVKQIDREMDR